jgi:hypothetical protein
VLASRSRRDRVGCGSWFLSGCLVVDVVNVTYLTSTCSSESLGREGRATDATPMTQNVCIAGEGSGARITRAHIRAPQQKQLGTEMERTDKVTAKLM